MTFFLTSKSVDQTSVASFTDADSKNIKKYSTDPEETASCGWTPVTVSVASAWIDDPFFRVIENHHPKVSLKFMVDNSSNIQLCIYIYVYNIIYYIILYILYI